MNDAISYDQKAIIIRTWKGFRRIFTDDIMYIECDIQGLKIVLNKKNFCECPLSLKALSLFLNGLGFFRIHRKHIVNLAYVEEYDKDKHKLILLKDEEFVHLEVSRRKINSFLEAWQLFCSNSTEGGGREITH